MKQGAVSVMFQMGSDKSLVKRELVQFNCLERRVLGAIKPESPFTQHSESSGSFFSFSFFHEKDEFTVNWTSRHIPAVCQRDGNC